MNRLLFVLLFGIILCFSASVTNDNGPVTTVAPPVDVVLGQEPVLFFVNFITPIEGETLSGDIIAKVNATVLNNIPLLLRWNNDSWIDIIGRYNETSHFYEYPMDVSCLPAGNVTFEVMQDTGHGVLHASVEVIVEWQRPPILVVCDYDNATIIEYYTNVLKTLGFAELVGYSTWNTFTNGSPTADDLLEYQFVIWFKGGDTTAFSMAERTAIDTFLLDSSSRKMLLTGTEIAWRAYNGGGYEAWLSANFGVNDYIGDGSNSENILGSVGTPYFGTNYTYGGGDGSHMAGGADWVRTMEFSQGLLEFASSGYDEYAATRSPFAYGIFFGFAFDSISTSVERLDLMNRTINYLEIHDPPQISILSPFEGELHKSPLVLNWESTSDIPAIAYYPTYKIFVDGQLAVDYWSLETYPLQLSDGNHSIRIVCEDNYGQRAYDSVSIEVDAICPINELANLAEGAVLKSGSLLVFSIIDTHLDNVVSGWDSDPWTPFSSPYEAYLPSGDGVHVFHLNSTDTVGNWNYTQFSLTCDDTPPDITLINQLNGSSMVSGTKIGLEINDTYLDIVTYHWDFDEDSDFELEYETSLPAGEGVHNLFVNATDLAGNQKLVYYQFFTDDTAPTILLLNISNNTILQTGTQMNFQIDDLHFDLVGWSWDSGNIVYYDEPTFALYVPAVEGIHQLFINASDAAGNSHSGTYQFMVDNTAPEIVLLSPTEGTTIMGGTVITVDVADTHLETVRFRWDLEEWSDWNDPYVTSAPADDGFHSLFVEAIDEAENWIQVVFVFQIDNDSGTTTPSPTGGFPIDFPASLGILGLGIGIGIVVSFLIFHLLTRRRSKSA